MNKKIFGIKISTLITLFACLTVAFLIWLYANYTAMTDEKNVLDSALSLINRG